MTTKTTKQTIWIVRYGLTKFPLVENEGPFDSPIDPNEGVEHAKCIADRIAADTSDRPTMIFSSPFLRTAETADIIAAHCGCKTRIEEGLTEWLTPSLLVDTSGSRTQPRPLSQLIQLYDTVDKMYPSINPVIPDEAPPNRIPKGSPHFAETEEALLRRCETTMTRLLNVAQGASFAIVSHAPCDQAVALFLEGKTSDPSDSALGPWPLGGITKFSRQSPDDKTWTMDLYGDTEHMPGIYKPGIKKWSLPCLEK